MVYGLWSISKERPLNTSRLIGTSLLHAPAFLEETLEKKNPSVNSICIICFDSDGNFEMRRFGDGDRANLAWAAAVLLKESVNTED